MDDPPLKVLLVEDDEDDYILTREFLVEIRGDNFGGGLVSVPLLSRYLDDLAQFYGRQGNSQRLARAMLTKLATATMEDIFQDGLHEFIQNFIAENNRLGNAITEQYLT